MRTWRVQIHHDRAKIWETAQAEHPTLAETLRVAIEDAEQRGWAKLSPMDEWGDRAGDAMA